MKTVGELLAHRAETNKDKIVFRFLEDGEIESAQITFSQLFENACKIASQIEIQTESGVSSNKRAILAFPVGIEFIETFFACILCGYTAIPMYPPELVSRQKGLEQLLALAQDSDAGLVLCPGDLERLWSCEQTKQMKFFHPHIESTSSKFDFKPELQSDIPVIQYTSGSTETPRGVMLSHENILANEAMIKKAFRHNEESLTVSWLPVGHDMGLLGSIMQPVYAGFPAVLMSPFSFVAKPVRWLAAIQKYNATTSGGPNFAYELCSKKINNEDCSNMNLDLSCWKLAFNGAEPVRAATINAFSEKFSKFGFSRNSFFPCYGLAEATLYVSGSGGFAQECRSLKLDSDALAKNQVKKVESSTCGVKEIVSSGFPAEGLTVKIASEGESEIGEIFIKGPSVAKGYFNRESENVFGMDGDFLATGDLGFVDNNELFITGRLKDLIKIHGLNKYPQDIEQVAESAHPKVKAGGCAAFAVDNGTAEDLVLFAEINEGGDLDQIGGAIKQKINAELRLALDVIVLVPAGSLPKTSSGKPQRQECLKRYLLKNYDGYWIGI